MIMSKSQIQITMCVAVLATSAGAMAAGDIYYDNSGTSSTIQTSTRELGNAISLALPAGSYGITKFQFEAYSPAAGQGTLRFFDGTGAAPGAQIGSDATFNISSGYHTISYGNVDGSAFTSLPSSFIWTVSFNTAGAGLVLTGPPTVGSAQNAYFEHTTGSANDWQNYLIDGGASVATFSARVTAIPEPSTISLGLMAIAALGYMGLRRNS